MVTIKIGSSTNRKGITVEPSVVLFNGNNVKKIMSGAISIWEKVEALVPILTSNNGSNGVVISNGGTNPYFVFDGNNSTYWTSPSSKVGQYVGYHFNSAVAVKKVTYYANSEWFPVKIQGSNNGSNWVDLTESFKPTTKTLTTIQLNNNTPYLYYRWTNIEAMNGVKELNTLQFYG